MSIFGFGASKQDAKSQSTQLGISNSLQGSNSNSFSQGSSSSVGGGQSSQQIAFQDLFQRMYGGASGAAVGINTGGLTDQANQLFSGGVGFLSQLQGGAGQDYVTQRLQGGSGLVDEQIAALGSDLGGFLRNELNPAITTRGVATGTLGGGRQGVAQGMAADNVTRQFQQGAVALRSNDQAQRDQAAQALMAQQGTNAGIGLNALPGMYGLAQSGAMAGLAPYQALASIMGGPTTLTESSQFSNATSQDIANSIASSFGTSSSYDYGQSTSNSKGRSFNFGVG